MFIARSNTVLAADRCELSSSPLRGDVSSSNYKQAPSPGTLSYGASFISSTNGSNRIVPTARNARPPRPSHDIPHWRHNHRNDLPSTSSRRQSSKTRNYRKKRKSRTHKPGTKVRGVGKVSITRNRTTFTSDVSKHGTPLPHIQPRLFPPQHQSSLSEADFRIAISKKPYAPTNPTFCDNTSQADFSTFSGMLQSLPGDGASFDSSTGRNEQKMAELRQAYQRFAVAYKSRSKSRSSQPKNRTTSNSTSLKSSGESYSSTTTAITQRHHPIAYDPSQPQYSTHYDPDPFRNDREYSPFSFCWFD
jgi:hypothetical protein